MPRLRTTTGLSALTLLVGIAGTGWLSGQTRQWQQPSDRVAMVRPTHATPRRPSTVPRRDGPVRVVHRRDHLSGAGTVQAAVSAPPTILQPLATPDDTSQSWAQLRGHLDGRVIVQVLVDATGRVGRARVVASSGDPILDEHALRSVRGWRFAVPPGHPDGLSGELPMRFSSQGQALGML